MDKWTLFLDCIRKSWCKSGKPREILAAVSGGADSVAMLYGMHVLAGEENLLLCACHVDHGLRESSGDDAEFTLSACRELGVPCMVTKVQIADSGENSAREARYEALYAAAEQFGVSCIALAHHMRDQAETMLLHLMRGCGTEGIGGMAEKRIAKTHDGREMLLWRPLLTVSPDEMRLMLQEKRIPWRDDETNASDAYLRNYVRHHVLPAIRLRAPDAEEAMMRAAAVFRREDEYLAKVSADFLKKHAILEGPCRCIRMKPLMDLHPAVRARVIRNAFPGDMDYIATEGLLFLEPGGKMNLPKGYMALATEKWLHFVPPAAEEAPLGKILVLPFEGDLGDGIRRQAMPKSVFEQARLRRRLKGEYIHPLGGPGNKSLQDYWVDRKVDRPFRAYLPILCIGQQVIWSIGVGPGEEARVRPGEDCVLLRYEGYLPGEITGSNKE